VPYIEDRIVHDADSHIFEPPGFYEPWLAPGMKERLARFFPDPHPKMVKYIEDVTNRQRDPEVAARDEAEITLRKSYEGRGAFLKEDRPRALDLLGVASQLVFTTTLLGPLIIAEHGEDLEAAYALAKAHNDAMLDFCSVDRRMLPVCYVPLADLERTPAFAADALADGASALMISSLCPENHSPSHVGLEPLWAAAAEAGVPIVLHVGGGKPMNPTYKQNGLPPVPDFTGGDGNFTSLSFMAVPDAPIHTLSALIFDNVLERHPDLRIGVIEQGASWVPAWMRSMDAAAVAFYKNEERLHSLSLKPSEYVQRQIRVTPYPHEDAGWIVEQAGPSVALFSSDYPHTEGGRNPVKRFEESLAGRSDAEKDAFYRTNFEDLMGRALDRVGITPAARS